MKKRRLRGWVKTTLKILFLILLFSILLFIIQIGTRNIESNADKCDSKMGHTCTYYELRQYDIHN